MYVQKVFEEARVDVMYDLIDQNPLGVLTVYGAEGLNSNHIPFTLERRNGGLGMLRGHVAKANPLYKQVQEGEDGLVVFMGQNAYISPSWSPRRYTTGKVQPSWAYVAVHALCEIQFRSDEEWISHHFEESVETFERDCQNPWKVSEAPEDFVSHLKKHVVGIELRIKELQGKWQLMQQRGVEDRLSIIEGLKLRNKSGADEIASLIEKTI